MAKKHKSHHNIDIPRITILLTELEDRLKDIERKVEKLDNKIDEIDNKEPHRMIFSVSTKNNN